MAKLSFNANGGTGAPSSITYTKGDTITIPTKKPTRSGYEFQIWLDARVADDDRVNAIKHSLILPGSSYDTTYWAITTLYAYWEKIVTPTTYTLYFNANGGSCSTASKTITKGSTYGTLPTPTRSGYDFDGWYTQATGGTYVSSSTTHNTTSDVTVYAHWSLRITYHYIYYNVNGGSGSIASTSFVEGSSVYITSSTPTPPSGYVFSSWNTNSSGTGTDYYPSNYYTGSKYANVTLYAIYRRKSLGYYNECNIIGTYYNDIKYNKIKFNS